MSGRPPLSGLSRAGSVLSVLGVLAMGGALVWSTWAVVEASAEVARVEARCLALEHEAAALADSVAQLRAVRDALVAYGARVGDEAEIGAIVEESAPTADRPAPPIEPTAPPIEPTAPPVEPTAPPADPTAPPADRPEAERRTARLVVPSRRWAVAIRPFGAALQEAGYRVAGPVVSDAPPPVTEVRFGSDAHRAEAERVAERLRRVVATPVRVRRVQTGATVEVWIGERAGPQGAPPPSRRDG